MQDGLELKYDKKIHAKIIVADRTVGVVSSMNFFPESSAGASWEAGLVSIDPKVVESIVQSIIMRLG